MAFIKVKKVALNIDNIKKAVKDNPFFSVMGITQEGINEIPKEEIVYINTDNVIAISDMVPTCIGDGSKCMKVYFKTDEYWTIECDESIIKQLN